MTRADERMNPIHFGSDPADIRIRNPQIWIRIPDQIMALAEFALFECSCFASVSKSSENGPILPWTGQEQNQELDRFELYFR